MNRVIFDFDGVLLDSKDELIVTGYNVRRDSCVKSLSEIPTPLINFMTKHRTYARNAGETAYLAALAYDARENTVMSREEFLERLSHLLKEDLLTLQKNFFAARGRFLAEDKEAWYALNTPFQPLWDFVSKNTAPSILTYKNEEAVRELARHYGLELAAVYSIPTGTPKAKKLQELVEEFKGDKLFYVDDSYTNLSEIYSFGVKGVELLLATWGYGCPEECKGGNLVGMKAIQQQDLIDIMS